MSRWSAPRRPRRLRATEWGIVSQPRADVAILGGGPGGYEAALVAAQLGARVTVVEADGLGGACVLTDCVPSKTLIATSEMMAALEGSAGLGIRYGSGGTRAATVDAPRLYSRVLALARAQSGDVAGRLAAEGVEVRSGAGRLVGPRTVAAGDAGVSADSVLVATGARPRGDRCGVRQRLPGAGLTGHAGGLARPRAPGGGRRRGDGGRGRVPAARH